MLMTYRATKADSSKVEDSCGEGSRSSGHRTNSSTQQFLYLTKHQKIPHGRLCHHPPEKDIMAFSIFTQKGIERS